MTFISPLHSESYWNGDTYAVELLGGGESNFLTKARYTIFIPKGLENIKGVFIHQHGCGAEGRGEPMAQDAQYQAFAKKWGLAILGTDLYPKSGSNCFDWINPEDGSGPALIAALDSLARKSGHSELNTTPWLLWGHSGGGYWVLAMTKEYPERVIATVSYSPGLLPTFDYPAEAAKIPVLVRHAGANDFNAPGIDCWGTSLIAFSKLRSMGGLASIAYNANQNHGFSFLRLMTIPFFDAVLSQRLPADGLSQLREMDQSRAWLVDTITSGTPKIYKSSTFEGNPLSKSWMPDSVCASKFKEFLILGYVKDFTPPPAPFKIEIDSSAGNYNFIIKWSADADIESGISHFNIFINGTYFSRYPQSGLFQVFNTNGDTPIPTVQPLMQYAVSGIPLSYIDSISISTVHNFFGLESPKFTWIRDKIADTLKIENFTKELISCAGTKNNYIECNAYSKYGQELHYQWYKDFSRLEAENSSRLVFSKFDSNSTGIYQCMVYISAESAVWSGYIPVYAVSVPVIIDQSKDIADAIIGENYKFEVIVHSNGFPPAYKDSIQWFKYTAKTGEKTALNTNSRFSGTNSLQLVITGLSNLDICEQGDYYFVEIISLCGKVVSNHFTISKISEIVIIYSSKDTSICESNVAEIKVDYQAKNCDSLSFHWFFNDKPISNSENIEFNEADLKISKTKISNSGKYFLEIEAINENIIVRSESTYITVNEKPQIVSQSTESMIIDEGENFELNVEAVSFDTIHYQWFRNSVLLPGYNSKSIIKMNAELNDAGIYYCEITNICGTVNSEIINLIVTPLTNVTDIHSELSIHPNPATEYIEITVAINPTVNRRVDEGSEIKIYNTLGECVLTEPIHPMTPSHRMNVESLLRGVYYLRIGNRTQMFVKM